MNRKTTVTCIALTIATAAPLLFSIPASALTTPAPTPSSSATPPASTSTPPASEGDAAAPIVADAGVYDLTVVSDNRGALVPGVKGKVSYRVQGDQDAPGFVPALVKKGQSMSWVASLPKGVILDSEIIDGNNHLFDRSYVKRKNPDGTMDIIGTYTATHGDQLLDFSRYLVKIPVRVTERLEEGAAVSTTFNPPAGYASENATASADVQTDDVVVDLGVYDLTAATADGGHFTPGKTGKLTFSPFPADPQSAARLSLRESVTWQVRVPAGLTVGDVTQPSVSVLHATEETTVNEDGSTTVTFTRINTSSGAFELTPGFFPRPSTIEVTATEALQPGATVESTFTPPAGYTSEHLAATVDVPVAEEVPVPEFAVTSPDDGAEVETTDKTIHVTGTAGAGRANVKAPNGALAGAVQTADGEWNLDMVGVPYGEDLTAVAYYVPAGSGQSQQRAFTFTHVNPTPEVPTPEFAVTSPDDGAEVETTDKTIHVTGTAGAGRANVKAPNGALAGAVQTADGEWNLDMVGVPYGEDLTAVAYYVPAGSGQSQQRAFTFTHTEKANS